VTIGAEPFALRPLSLAIVDGSDGSLWALLPESPSLAVQWTLWAWLAALFGVGAVTLALGVCAIMRWRRGGERPSLGTAARADLGREARAHERAVPDAISGSTGSGGDLASTAQETLDVVRHRLEARREIERHISEKLDLEELLVIVATSARRLIGGAFSIVYLREGDVLCPRAFTGLPDFIRDTRVPVGAGVAGTAVATGEGIIANDYPASPLARPPFDNVALRALAQPLLGAGQALGVMLIGRADTDAPFTADDLSTLGDLATQAAVAIDNASLFAEAKRSAAEYQALFEVAGLVSSTLDIEPLLDLVVERCRQLMGVAAAGIVKLDTDTGVFTYERGVGLSHDFVRALRVQPGEGTSGRAGRDRAPAWSADILEDPAIDLTPETREMVVGEGYRAVLSVPILIKGEPYGVLAVYWWDPHTPSRSEIALLSALAGQAAIAIENARLYADVATHAAALDARATRLRTLARLTSTVSASLDAGVVLDAIVKAAAEIMRSPFVCVYVADEGSSMLELRAASDEGIVAALPARQRRFGEGLVGWVAEHRRPLEVADVLADERAGSREWARANGLRSFLGVPIIFQDSLLGVLTLSGAGPSDLGADDRGLVESFVGQAAVAIRNTRLYAETTRHLEETRAMLEVAEILNSTLDPQRVLKRVAIKIAQVCRVDRCSIERWDGDRVTPLMSQFADGRKDDRLWAAFMDQKGAPLRDVPAHAEAIATRRPVVISDTAATDLIPRDWIDVFGQKSYMAVPLIRQEAVIGVMTLDVVDRPRPFERGQVDLAMAIAGQLALTLDNTRLYGEAQDAQDQLVRTEKLRAMGEMASGVAHDFNNVLAGILGRAQLLLGRVEDPKLRRWLEVIERSALDGARTVRRLQDFTRIRRDHPVVPTNLNQVVQQTLEATESSWRQEAQRRGIQIELITSLAAPIPDVPGDPAELREALTNLILNALDAMPGGGTLALTTSAAPDHVEIAVADTGVGIPAGIRHKIFDPFFTTKGPKGTGLGLSMTYGILARHGARISVESEEGRGATFRLVFPVGLEGCAPAPPPETPPAPARSLHCLVVDDEEIVAAVLGDMLASEGHKVEVVDSGQEAIARFSAGAFDLVLTDLAMPGMTGWEVARAIKDMAPAVRVVLVSGFGVEVSPADLEARGVDLVLAKPLKLQDIGSIVGLARSARGA
jgi:GAF domain-containing protein